MDQKIPQLNRLDELILLKIDINNQISARQLRSFLETDISGIYKSLNRLLEIGAVEKTNKKPFQYYIIDKTWLKKIK